MPRGIINLDNLNKKFIVQDREFRLYSDRVVDMAGMTEQQKQTHIMAEGLAVIHERLGNMITLLLSSGGS